jgi:hypothetical protein
MRDCGIEGERGKYTNKGLREREASEGVREGLREREESMGVRE